LLVSASLTIAGFAHAGPLPVVPPSEVGLSASRLQAIDALVQSAVNRRTIPGAVLMVGRQGKLVVRKAYGNRALRDRTERNSLETIYDLASLTKVIATTSSILKLQEEGQLQLSDRIGLYLPEAATSGKEAITIESLLRHR